MKIIFGKTTEILLKLGQDDLFVITVRSVILTRSFSSFLNPRQVLCQVLLKRQIHLPLDLDALSLG